MKDPLLVIVILNWNDAPQTIECLENLEKVTYSNFQILVIDNGSKDNSKAILNKSLPMNPTIIATGINKGYAGGNNVGIKEALRRGAEWILLLNNDAYLDSNALQTLVETGLNYPHVGILGPTIFNTDSSCIIQSAGGWIDKLWRAGHIRQGETYQSASRDPIEVDWVSGCVLLARSEMIRQIGLLDERFFLYWEELDWCVRARKANWQILHVPTAHAWHKGGNPTSDPKPYITYYMTRNFFLLLQKHKAGFLAWINALFSTFRTLISWSLLPKWRGNRTHRDALWYGLIDFILHRFGSMPFRS